MTQVFSKKSPNELALRDVERALSRHTITIGVEDGVILIIFADGAMCHVCDTDMGGHTFGGLPRSNDERLVITNSKKENQNEK